MSDSVRHCGLQPARLFRPWDSPARILEQPAMPSSRGSSQPRDQTHISCLTCIGRWILHHECHLGTWFIFFPFLYHLRTLVSLNSTYPSPDYIADILLPPTVLHYRFFFFFKFFSSWNLNHCLKFKTLLYT